MGAVSSKSKPRKSMRVATIFTGVAACTVGVTQVANAQDVTHAAHKASAKHIGRQLRPEVSRFGSIRSNSGCVYKDADPTWVHAYWWDASQDTSLSMCYGFKGDIVSPPGVGITYECGGNNHGSMLGYSDNGNKQWLYDYGPATTYTHLNKGSLYQIGIWSWTGTDKCPQL
jgi:hypothetical protein